MVGTKIVIVDGQEYDIRSMELSRRLLCFIIKPTKYVNPEKNIDIFLNRNGISLQEGLGLETVEKIVERKLIELKNSDFEVETFEFIGFIMK
jgi:hypothetical protein